MSQQIYKHTFKVGDVVRWSSQAGGFSKEKKGTIIEVVPADRQPIKVNSNSTRRHESYVVEVPRESGRKTLKPEAYWPVRSQLAPAKAKKSGGGKPKKVKDAELKLPEKVTDRPYPADESADGDDEATDDANVRDQRHDDADPGIEADGEDDDIEGDD
jgi:hypothetical protein